MEGRRGGKIRIVGWRIIGEEKMRIGGWRVGGEEK